MSLTIVLITVVSFNLMSQDLNLDQVLSAYYKAIGMAKINEWKTLTMTCKSSFQGVEFPVTIITKRPGKIRTEVEIQGNKSIQAFDGTIGWSISFGEGSLEPQDLTLDEIKSMKDQADIDGALFNWKEKGHKVELIGMEDVDGTQTYKVKIIKANGDIETDFIDADSFIPIKITAVSIIQGNESESESYPGNYKEVNGAMLPFVLENKFKGQNDQMVTQYILIDKYEVDKDVDDLLFVKPGKKH